MFSWQVESVLLAVGRVEIIVGGDVAHETDAGGALQSSGSVPLDISVPTWIALRVRGSFHGNPVQVAAHTSAIQVTVNREKRFHADGRRCRTSSNRGSDRLR